MLTHQMDMRRYAVSNGAAAREVRALRIAAQDVETARRTRRAVSLGLAWPRPPVRAGVGRPSRQQKFINALYELVPTHHDLSGVPRQMPAGWEPRQSLLPAEVADDVAGWLALLAPEPAATEGQEVHTTHGPRGSCPGSRP